MAGLILYGSLLRDVRLPLVGSFPHIDKVVHLLMYALLSIVFWGSLRRDGVSVVKSAVLGILLPVLYGGLIEVLQECFFPPRTGDIFDWLSDIIGVFIGYFTGVMLCKMKNN